MEGWTSIRKIGFRDMHYAQAERFTPILEVELHVQVVQNTSGKDWKQEMHRVLSSYRPISPNTTSVPAINVLFNRNFRTILPRKKEQLKSDTIIIKLITESSLSVSTMSTREQ